MLERWQSMSLDLNGLDALLIGGVSGAGKTVVAARVRRENPQFETLKMDTLLGALDEVTGAGRALPSHAENVAAMEKLGPALCDVVLRSGSKTIIEGGWIDPPAWEARVDAHGRRAAALFFGYPFITAEGLLDRLRGTMHWLSTSDDLAFVEAQIAHSVRLRRQLAGSRSAAFVDVSEGFRSEREIAELLRPLVAGAQG